MTGARLCKCGHPMSVHAPMSAAEKQGWWGCAKCYCWPALDAIDEEHAAAQEEGTP